MRPFLKTLLPALAVVLALSAFAVVPARAEPGEGGQDEISAQIQKQMDKIIELMERNEKALLALSTGDKAKPEAVEVVIESIPGYAPLFTAAFPGDEQPISYDNMARAIGVFERRLMTPAPFDDFLRGDDSALDAKQLAGLQRFMDTGCTACHSGPLVGGGMYQKLGVVKAYEDDDKGRMEVTGEEVDLQVFKVPSLRNVAETGPWFHNGKVTTLAEAIRLMAWHQLGVELDADAVGEIEAFLGSLTGRVDAEYVALPELPPNGPKTPAPDPS